MRATDLSRSIWNAIADLARRSQSPREIYFSEVTRVDAVSQLIYAADFGDVAIPLVAFDRAIAYYDTVPTGVAGSTVNTQVERREDKTHTNKNYLSQVVLPKVGDVVVVLDLWGAKRFPVCIGLLRGNANAWSDLGG